MNVNFGAELNNVPKSDGLFSVSDEKGLGYERCILIKNLWLKKTMEVGSLIISFQIASALEMIRVSIVNFLIIFIEDLKLKEVNALLEQINVSEVLYVKHKFGPSSIHILVC